MSSWTTERIEALKQMWAQNLTYQQIATALGGGLTRNAVSGKVNYLGLSPKNTSARPKKAKPAPSPRGSNSMVRPKVPSTRKRAARKPQVRTPKVSEPTVETDLTEPVSLNISILEIGKKQCRWVSGKDARGIFHCGHPTGDILEQYCPYHRKEKRRPGYSPTGAAKKKREARAETTRLRAMVPNL